MIRQHVKMKHKQKKDKIRWRGHEVSRIEAFTDAVFAFAVTLLIVSLEVLKTFDKLVEELIGFIPFGFGFMFLFYIWGLHHEFFRRYALNDGYTHALSAILIVVVLFFVYPLKFLASFIIALIAESKLILEGKDVYKLMIIYSGAFMAVFTLLFLMYRHALNCRDELELTESEVFETKTTMYDQAIMLSIGTASILLALLLPRMPFFSGIIYAFSGIPIGIMKSRRGKIHRLKFGVVEKKED